MLNGIINGLSHAIAYFGKWWKRSSPVAKVIVIAIVVSIVAVLLGFLFNDSSSQVGSKQDSKQLTASTQEKAKKNIKKVDSHSKNSKNNNNSKNSSENKPQQKDEKNSGKTDAANKPQQNKDSQTNNADLASKTQQERKPSQTNTSAQPRTEAPATESAYWMNPTGGAYPNISGIPASQLQIQVNLAEQRVHIIANGETVYTMIMSSGLNDSTPRGDYRIGMRGAHFFNAQEGVGADYWVGFIGGVYLFHTVPTGYNFASYIPSEGAKLGTPASHGCVRLSVSDARWFYQNIPSGAAVHIG